MNAIVDNFTEHEVHAPRPPLVQRSRAFVTARGGAPEDQREIFSETSVTNVLQTLLRWNVEDSDRPIAFIAHAAAGVGKTTRTIISLGQLLKGEFAGKTVLHLCINHKLAKETLENYQEAGLTAELFQGKTREDACKRSEVVREAMQLGVPTSDFCKSTDAKTGEEVLCEHYVSTAE